MPVLPRNLFDSFGKARTISETRMNKLGTVFAFGWPYLRRYWARLLAGMLFAVLFGLSNAGFVWATKTLVGRMAPPAVTDSGPGPAPNSPPPPPARLSRFQEWRGRLDRATERLVDPWLPRAGQANLQQILGGLVFLPLLVALRGVAGYVSSYCMTWVGERAINDLRLEVMQKISGLSLDFFTRSTMGDLLTRINGDTLALQRCLRLGFADLVKEPVAIVSILGALCLIDWKLTLGSLIFFPLCLAPVLVLGKKARKASRAVWKASIFQSSLTVEMLAGIRVVKAFGLEEILVARFRKLSENFFRNNMKGVRAKELLNPFIEVIAMFGLGVLIVYIAISRKTVEDMVGFLTGVVFFYNPVKKLAALHVLFEQTSIGVERLTHTLKEQPSVQEAPHPKPLRQFSTAIDFEHVTFSYGHQTVLREVTLNVPHGFKLGVAGESGSGKSTLVNLLFRFYDPTQGAIRMDGQDLRTVSLRELRLLMALVSQEVILFDESVAANIARGKPSATQQEIEAAARSAFAHDFVLKLPQGYDTRIGEQGVTLSGGQRQRLAIARAFVRNAPILVLDEATGALDSHAEAEVQSAIERLEENRTVICVAHRLSTLAGMDRIIVLSDGRIVEEGGFKELLKRGGPFAQMARRQGIVAGDGVTRSLLK